MTKVSDELLQKLLSQCSSDREIVRELRETYNIRITQQAITYRRWKLTGGKMRR